MTKFFNKWTRKTHRWIAVPTAIMIPTAVILKFSGGGKLLPPQWEQFQSILMLMLAISGAYLFLVPYIAKQQRKNRKKNQRSSQVGHSDLCQGFGKCVTVLIQKIDNTHITQEDADRFTEIHDALIEAGIMQ